MSNIAESRSSPGFRGLLFAIWLVVSIASLAVLVGVGARLARGPATDETGPAAVAPPPMQLPDFDLVEKSGRRVTRADLLGRPAVFGFIFTRCGSTCPMVTGVMAQLRAELPKEILLVSITVDPKFDTPKVLTDYARGHGADNSDWWFLTGDEKPVRELIENGFRVSARENPDFLKNGGERVIHSTSLALVDQKGMIVGYFSASDQSSLAALKQRAMRLIELKQ